MHVVVVGAGALGSAIALGLAESGGNVTLIARGARLAWLRDHPLELEHAGGVRAKAVPVCDWAGLTAPVDAVIFCTKMAGLVEAAGHVAPLLAPGARAVALQNGVEAPDLLAAALPGAAVIAGRVHGFFEMDGQRVRHVGVAPSVALGGANPAGRREAPAAARLLEQAGFGCTVSADIRRELWEKLMLSAGAAGVAMMLGTPVGQVCATDGGEALLCAALEEVTTVAQACGAMLGRNDIEQTIGFVRRFPPEATTSLQRDVAAGAPSEYDALIGAVLRLAASHGVAVLTFQRIDAAVRPADQ